MRDSSSQLVRATVAQAVAAGVATEVTDEADDEEHAVTQTWSALVRASDAEKKRAYLSALVFREPVRRALCPTLSVVRAGGPAVADTDVRLEHAASALEVSKVVLLPIPASASKHQSTACC